MTKHKIKAHGQEAFLLETPPRPTFEEIQEEVEIQLSSFIESYREVDKVVRDTGAIHAITCYLELRQILLVIKVLKLHI